MPLVEIEISLKIDGNLVDGYPIIRRILQAEEVHKRVQKPNGDGASYFQASVLATDNHVIVQTDAPINLRLNNQSTGQIPLNAGGVLILIDGNLSAGSTTNILVNNQGTGPANILIDEVGP